MRVASDLCRCGHARRLHGSRAGLVLPDLRCRAWSNGDDCACTHFNKELNE